MTLSIKLSPFMSHLFWTTLATLAGVVANFFVLRWITAGLGSEEFGAYSLANRFISTLAPFATCAMGTALARYVSLSKNNASASEYLVSAFLISMLPTLILLGIGFLWSEGLAHQSLFRAALFFLVGYSWFLIVNAFYLGSGKIQAVNFWQWAIGVFGSLAVAKTYASHGRADKIIFMMAMLYFASSVPLFFYLGRAYLADRMMLVRLAKPIQELLRYGLPRTAEGVLLAAQLSVGVFLASSFGSLRDAGYLAIGLSFLRITEIGTVAFALLVLPQAGRLISEGSHRFLKERVEDILSLSFQVGLFVMLHLFLWCDVLLDFWLGPSYVPSLPLLRILVLGTGPYLIYVMLRPVIDALQEKPVNARNLFFACLVTFCSSLIAERFLGAAGLAFGTLLGLLALAALSFWQLFKIYGFDRYSFAVVKTVLINAALVLFAFLLKKGSILFAAGLEFLLFAVGLELLFFASYLVILRFLDTRWLKELEKRVICVFPET